MELLVVILSLKSRLKHLKRERELISWADSQVLWFDVEAEIKHLELSDIQKSGPKLQARNGRH